MKIRFITFFLFFVVILGQLVYAKEGSEVHKLEDPDKPILMYLNSKIFDPATGVEIIWGHELDMFSEEWLAEPVAIDSKPILEIFAPKYLDIILDCLKKYPASFITKSNLKRIYLMRELKFCGKYFCGTFDRDRIYIAIAMPGQLLDNETIEQTFHHEFSHLLFLKYIKNFSVINWRKNLPQNFSYEEDYVDEIYESSERLYYIVYRGFLNNCGYPWYNFKLEFDDHFLKMGFLFGYATYSLHEDFASIAENLFRPRPEFWDFVSRYEKIREKTQLVIDFYHSIDPIFTEEYFRRFSSEIR